MAGRRIGEDYCSTALAYGYDLRRFYDPAVGERELCLCAYCAAGQAIGAPVCVKCGQPTGLDAPVATTVQELARETRRAVRHLRGTATVVRTYLSLVSRAQVVMSADQASTDRLAGARGR